MAFSFDQIFAADPANPANVAGNASVLIYAPGDATKAPLAITDTSGSPLPNPITVNANGFASAFMHATLDRVAWDGGGFTGYFTSYEGIKQVAVAAQVAAETAAATAGAEAAAVADAAIAGATDEATAAKTAAQNAATAATASANAAANAAALVGAPADTAIAAAVNGTGTATKAALNATILDKIKTDSVPKWKANTAYLAGDPVVAPTGEVVTAKVGFTAGASYSAANWNSTIASALTTPGNAARTAVEGVANDAAATVQRDALTRSTPNRALSVKTMIANLGASGHGWESFGAAGFTAVLNDTTTPLIGTQSLKMTATGSSYGWANKTTAFATPINMSGGILRFYLKLGTDFSHINSISVWLTSTNNWSNYRTGEILTLPAHTNETSLVRGGEYAAVDVYVDAMQTVVGTGADLSAINNIRVNISAYNGGPAEVWLGGIALLRKPARFPNGVITLSFDDSYVDAYTKARPYMAKYGFPGQLYPTLENVDATGKLTLQNMKDLQNLHGWEIGVHAISDALHAPVSTKTPDQVRDEFEYMIRWQQTNGFRGRHYAWPNAASTDWAEAIASEYFETARLGVKQTIETYPACNPMRMRAMNAAQETLTALQTRVDRIKLTGGWGQLFFHDLPTTKVGINQMAIADFQALMDYINTAGVPVLTTSQVLDPSVTA